MSDARPACVFCGAPLAFAKAAGPRYCCFGCRFAAAVSQEQGEKGWNAAQLARLGLAVFFTLNVVMFTMVLWAPDVYGADDTPFSRSLQSAFRYLCAALALPVLWLLGGPLLANAWESLKERTPTTDWLLLVGVAAAWAASLLAAFREEGPVYFEVACVVLLLVTLGRWLEATGKQKTLAELTRLDRLLPQTVTVLSGDVEKQIPLAELAPGCLAVVRPGERVPTDGLVERQPVWLDEQWLTGESMLRAKEVGETAFGGTLNAEGLLHLRVTARPSEGTIARFVALVRESLRQKGRWRRLADRLGQAFLPWVAFLALAAAGLHYWRGGFEPALMAFLGVLLIACPCALGIATPLATWTALGEAARRGVVCRSPEAFEKLNAARTVLFDKTGTLTCAPVRLAGLVVEGMGEGEAKNLAAALAAASAHPLSVALRSALPQPAALGPIRTVPGRGLTASSPEGPIWLGNRLALAEAGCRIPPKLEAALMSAEAAGEPIALLSRGGHAVALFRFSETLRPEAGPALAELAGLGLQVAVLTGDHPGRAAALSQELGVPALGGLLPQDKVREIEKAKAGGLTVMVGDGLNDAPALAASDIGVALGCGADLARDAADVCLLASDLRTLPWLFALARRTERTIKLNLFWALAYNSCGIALAFAGWLNPVWAALAMTLSSAFVVGNSLRLRGGAAADASPTEPAAKAGFELPTPTEGQPA